MSRPLSIPAERIEAVLALRAEGLSDVGIAARLGLAVSVVTSTIEAGRRRGDPRAVRRKLRRTIAEISAGAPSSRAEPRQQQMERLLAIISEAARAGLPCPGNKDLAKRLNFRSISGPADLLAEAERAGLVAVERGFITRTVAAADGSWRTAEIQRHQRPRRRAAAPALRSVTAERVRRGERQIEGRTDASLPARRFDLPPVHHRTCQWIHGDPCVPGWQFCDAPSAGGSWCAHHYARVYQVQMAEAA